MIELLRRLDADGYDFVTATPATVKRVRAARGESARTLRDILGWSLPFSAGAVDPEILALLERGEAICGSGSELRCKYRVSRLGNRLFLHSAYPTDRKDAVFFGPDSYRFVRFVLGQILAPASRLIDMGTGCGVGGICAAPMTPNASVVLVDSNPDALFLAGINAAAAGIDAETLRADSLDAVEGELDVVIANPPYMFDAAGRTYRDGGAMLGAQRSLEWALSAAARLAPRGRVILYTGSAIVDGCDRLRRALERELPRHGCALRYEEIDPDIFGEELDQPGYGGVERIAAIGAVIERIDFSGR